MRYLALASDGDGTLTEDGRMANELISALRKFRAAGGKVFLVTGEMIEDLAVFPRVDLFDRIVAENGAVIFNQQIGNERVLSEIDPSPVVEAIREISATDVKRGRVLVSTKENERRIQESLARHNLDRRIIHNRADRLILPRGIDKATGLAAALEEFGISPDRVAGVGDAENDAALIEFCGLGVAVANAIPELKQHARMVTRGRAGQGVIELIESILRDG